MSMFLFTISSQSHALII